MCLGLHGVSDVDSGWPNVSYPGAPEYSSPAGARLNSGSAWCVNASTFPEDDATLTIDLGRHRLLSGQSVRYTACCQVSLSGTPPAVRSVCQVHRLLSGQSVIHRLLSGQSVRYTACCQVSMSSTSPAVRSVCQVHRLLSGQSVRYTACCQVSLSYTACCQVSLSGTPPAVRSVC